MKEPFEHSQDSSKLGLGLVFGVVLGLGLIALLERYGLNPPLSSLIGFGSGLALGLIVGLALGWTAKQQGSGDD